MSGDGSFSQWLGIFSSGLSVGCRSPKAPSFVFFKLFSREQNEKSSCFFFHLETRQKTFSFAGGHGFIRILLLLSSGEPSQQPISSRSFVFIVLLLHIRHGKSYIWQSTPNLVNLVGASLCDFFITPLHRGVHNFFLRIVMSVGKR